MICFVLRKLKDLIVIAVLTASAYAPGCYAEDATFSPATVPAQTVIVKQAVPVTVPVETAQAANPMLAFLYSLLTNPAVVMVLAGCIIRVEGYVQSKTKINIANGAAIAHTIWNVLEERGVIAKGNVANIMDAFWAELSRQSLDHLGTVPNALIEDTAHATFAKLLKDNTDRSGPQMGGIPVPKPTIQPAPTMQAMLRGGIPQSQSI